MARLFGSRKPIPPQAAKQVAAKTFQAPIGGWATNKPMSFDGPGTALVLDNWFPTRTGIRARGGRRRHVTLPSAIETMWAYYGPFDEMFAATETAIYEVTNVANPDAPPAPVVSGQTGGVYSWQMFSTIADIYQAVVNGKDDMQLYDGTSWKAINGTSTPAITGIETDKFSAVWAHGSRLWFVEKSTLKAWYLPVDSIGGAAKSFLMSGVFRMGGTLLFGTTWSTDAGDGMDDKCLFVTDQGEVAIYSGTDPGDPAKWGIQGIYHLGSPPLGINAFYHVGGEPHFLTEQGVIPLGTVISQGGENLELAAVTLKIEDEWQRETTNRVNRRWPSVTWPQKDMLVIGLPRDGDYQEPYCYVANTTTGAWARYTNWDVQALAQIGPACFFGDRLGNVYEMEVGGKDDTQAYVSTCVMHFDDLDAPGMEKTLLQARGVFRTGNPLAAKISASINYEITIPSAPSVNQEFTTGDVWDAALWDQAKWDNNTSVRYIKTTYWQSIGLSGFSHAIQLQMSWSNTGTPNTELLKIDVTHEPGGLVV